MDAFLTYLWDVRAFVLVLSGIAIGLVIARFMIKKEPYQVEFDEVSDMIDLQGFFQKFGGEK